MRHSPPKSKKVIYALMLAALMAVTATILGCRGEKPGEPETPAAAPAVSSSATETVRTKEQAMSALMALPELKAWSSQLEKAFGGKVRGALIEYDSAPKLIDGKSYWQFSFVENGGEAAHRWESFLVSEQADTILVEDFASGKSLTLEQWRKEKQPMERTTAQ